MKIKIIDGHDVPSPEDRAMIQAMYSRSPAPVEAHLDQVAKVGSGKFMSQYYVGYGHQSIGDLGDTTVFLEGVSMAAAKAIQSTPLYRGQECSTRYIDFSTQPIIFNTDFSEVNANLTEYQEEATKSMERWRALYIKALPLVREYVARVYSPEFVLPERALSSLDGGQALYRKTLDAITFDICRGLLPIGCTTSVAWSGDLRSMADHLRYLMTFNVPEIEQLARQTYTALSEKYQHSFKELDENVISYGRYNHSPYFKDRSIKGLRMQMATDPSAFVRMRAFPTSAFDKEVVQLLPKEIQFAATFVIEDKIDYASYRDLQRHRPGFMSLSSPQEDAPMPANSWYLNHLTEAGGSELLTEIQDNWIKTQQLIETYLGFIDEGCAQYFYPMMVEVPVKMNWSLGQCIYVNNLRSGVTVHPTLRAKVNGWADFQSKLVGRNDLFRLDKRLDYQSTWRGDQGITRKPEGTT